MRALFVRGVLCLLGLCGLCGLPGCGTTTGNSVTSGTGATLDIYSAPVSPVFFSWSTPVTDLGMCVKRIRLDDAHGAPVAKPGETNEDGTPDS